MWDRVHNQKNFNLSNAGKEILLKAVIQAIPMHSMSVFKLPKKICKKIVTIMANFWWGFKKQKNKIYWQQWARLVEAKYDGSLGFRDIEAFNTVVLVKQIQRVLQFSDFQCLKSLKASIFGIEV